jgi:hypothetical protein
VETQHGYGVNQGETIGRDAKRVRVNQARVVRVTYARHRIVRKQRIAHVPMEVQLVQSVLLSSYNSRASENQVLVNSTSVLMVCSRYLVTNPIVHFRGSYIG